MVRYEDILQNHFLEMTLCSAAVDDFTKVSVTNALGVNVIFERADNETEHYNEGDLIINGESKVFETDLMATNGVMHIIDGVLTNRTGTFKSNHTLVLDPVSSIILLFVLRRYSILIGFGKT